MNVVPYVFLPSIVLHIYPQGITDKSITMEQLHITFGACSGQRKVVVFDCCYYNYYFVQKIQQQQHPH